MAFFFEPMDKTDARKIVDWRYEASYDVYNMVGEDLQYLLDPANAFYRIRNEQGELLAFCSFGRDGQVPGGDYRVDALDIGVGMRPDLIGRGRGFPYVQAVLNFAKDTFNPPAFRITIAEFNTRAQRVWEKAGFKQKQSFQATGNRQHFMVLMRPSRLQRIKEWNG